MDLGDCAGSRLRQNQFEPGHRVRHRQRRLQCPGRRCADGTQLLLGMDRADIVPKAALEYVRAATGSLQEVGGLEPVWQAVRRSSARGSCVGAEVGHYWISDQRILDLSAYGKFVDNVVQNFSCGHRQPRRPEHLPCRASARAGTGRMPAPAPRSA